MNTMKKLNQRLTFRFTLFHVSALLMFVTFSFEAHAQDTVAKREITLNGTAAGGVVSLMEVSPVYAGFVSVVTTQGESAEVVLNRLADEICRSDPFNWHNSPESRRYWVKITGNTLTLPGSGFRYVFSGTDKGFVILRPALSVSGSFDVERHQVSLCWINPPEQYDEIKVGSLTLPPHATNCVYECKLSETRTVPWGGVMGKRGESFSPPASIIIVQQRIGLWSK